MTKQELIDRSRFAHRVSQIIVAPAAVRGWDATVEPDPHNVALVNVRLAARYKRSIVEYIGIEEGEGEEVLLDRLLNIKSGYEAGGSLLPR